MVNTRGKKMTASSSKPPKANEVAENALSEGQTSHSLIVNVEEPNADGQFEEKVETPLEEAENEGSEDIPGEAESEKVTKVDNNDENILVNEMNNDNKAESEQNTSEDDETDDQDDLMWDDEGETSEEDNEENVGDEDEASDEEGDVSAEEASEEDDKEDGGSRQKGTEVAKGDERKAKAKEDVREAKEHNSDRLEAGLKSEKNLNERSRKKKVRVGRPKKVDSKDKPEPLRKKKGKKKGESMGMIFMCSSKTKNDCYQYRVLGLPESKKDIVEKIYTGMRLFLYDVDRKLMYGIYKAAGPGGYNIEPKAFKSQFPAQVRFTVLDDCLPLPEEKFKKVIKENYFTNTKFDCQLKAEQVNKLCRLFLASSKGHLSKKSHRIRKAENPHPPVRQERSRRRSVGGDERRPAFGEEPRYHERPRKRPRKLVISPPRQPPPAPLPSTVPSYVYERTSDVDAYRRDQYPYRDRRDPPLVIRRDPYIDGRDPYPERDYPYRDGLDIYPRGRDPYVDGRASYLERRDPYIDGRDTYLERRNPYRDATYPEPYSSYGRDPLSDGRDAYRECRGGEYRDSFRLEEVSERGVLHHPFSSETRHRHDIGSRDSYVSNRQRLSYADPMYSVEYPSRVGLAREYHL